MGNVAGRLLATPPGEIALSAIVLFELEVGIAKSTAPRKRKTQLQEFALLVNTWILHESEAFICKALKGEAIVHYAEPLITQQMKASGSPAG